jgi:hypothetical protein
MRRCVYWISLTLGVLLATHAARADDSFSFTIVPNSSDVLATPGSTVGWGYSITNNSTSDYLELTDIAATVSLTEDGAPDTNIFDLPILGPGPGSTITEDYDPIAYVGLLQFTWSPDPAENPVTGNVTLSAVFCSVMVTRWIRAPSAATRCIPNQQPILRR